MNKCENVGYFQRSNTLPTAEILSGISGLWVLNEIIQKNILKI